MELPLFYNAVLAETSLEGVEAYHAARSLRMQPGNLLLVTDGSGIRQTVRLDTVSEKKVRYTVLEQVETTPRPYRIHMAIAPTRKAERNEWMLEKLVELGVDTISFITAGHSHLQSYNRVVNRERLERIAVAAMKQSVQFFLPVIETGIAFDQLVETCTTAGRFIAYVPEKETAPHLAALSPGKESVTVLIGPEGDFTAAEITRAVHAGFKPVSLGATRLRTETAAVMGCHAVHLANLLFRTAAAGNLAS